MLKVENIESGYGSMQVLWKPRMEVREGTITALLGPNGAGKTTMLKTILGSVVPWGGNIWYFGEDITNAPTHRKVDMGIVLVPEGKHLFVDMSTYDNLIMGAYSKHAAKIMKGSLELVYNQNIFLCLFLPASCVYFAILIPYCREIAIRPFPCC